MLRAVRSAEQVGTPRLEHHVWNTTIGNHVWNTTIGTPRFEHHDWNTTIGTPRFEHHDWNTTFGNHVWNNTFGTPRLERVKAGEWVSHDVISLTISGLFSDPVNTLHCDSTIPLVYLKS